MWNDKENFSYLKNKTKTDVETLEFYYQLIAIFKHENRTKPF